MLDQQRMLKPKLPSLKYRLSCTEFLSFKQNSKTDFPITAAFQSLVLTRLFLVGSKELPV